MVGCTVFTTGASEFSNIESSLAMPHLYSSKMDFSGTNLIIHKRHRNDTNVILQKTVVEDSSSCNHIYNGTTQIMHPVVSFSY